MKGIILAVTGSDLGPRTFWTGAFLDEEIEIVGEEVRIVDSRGRVMDRIPASEVVHILEAQGDHYRLVRMYESSRESTRSAPKENVDPEGRRP